jgi:hypothetical protein
MRSPGKLVRPKPTVLEGDFLEAANLQSGPVLDGPYELAGFHKRIVRTRIEPGVASAEAFHVTSRRFEF